jgi:hypothetical protein
MVSGSFRSDSHIQVLPGLAFGVQGLLAGRFVPFLFRRLNCRGGLHVYLRKDKDTSWIRGYGIRLKASV